MFTIINGNKDESERKRKELKVKKRDLYIKNFAKKIVSDSYSDLLSAIFCGVKYINNYELNPKMTYKEYRFLFDFICMLKQNMRYIIVDDLITLFPIIKQYDGKKFECKDYYSTLEYLETIDREWYLEEGLDDFLWHYYNQDLMNLSIKELLILDRLRKFDGQKGLMEEWTDMLGVDTYIINEKEGYIYNKRTQKTEPFKKAVPRYLKLVK